MLAARALPPADPDIHDVLTPGTPTPTQTISFVRGGPSRGSAHYARWLPCVALESEWLDARITRRYTARSGTATRRSRRRDIADGRLYRRGTSASRRRS